MFSQVNFTLRRIKAFGKVPVCFLSPNGSVNPCKVKGIYPMSKCICKACPRRW
ncbi:hypothetical protein DsansV1_C01g0008731 [Dioscorea sansibarensis]